MDEQGFFSFRDVHLSKADVLFITRQAPRSRLLRVPVVRGLAARHFPNL